MKTLLLSISFLAVLASCKKEENPIQVENPTPQPQKKTLRYEITCPNCFVVHYEENEEQVATSGQSTGWYKELQVDPGFVALIAAQNQSESHAAVTATIKVDGVILKTQTTYCPVSGTVLVTDTIK